MMQRMLARLEAWLQAQRPLALATMNPGLDQRHWTAFEQQLGVSLPHAVRDYFAWRDGQSSDTYECLPPDEWEFLPSALVLRIKEQMDRDHQGLTEDESMDLSQWWRPGFIPFLCAPSGGYLCLDSKASTRQPAFAVVEFKHDTNDLVIRHASFEHWLETTVRTLEAGLFDWSASGSLGITDAQAYHRLCQQLNPGLPVTIAMRYRRP